MKKYYNKVLKIVFVGPPNAGKVNYVFILDILIISNNLGPIVPFLNGYNGNRF